MKLIVPILSQRDPKWREIRLGTVNGSTIGSEGCILTCMSMLATYYNHRIFPDQMDDWLTANNGYASGNLYLNTAFNREFPDCSFDHVVFCKDTPAPMDEIDWFLNHGFPVVVEVDFNYDSSDGIQTHFILIVGKTDDGYYIINDPWTGEEYFFDAKYGDPKISILQVNYFVGPVPNTVATSKPIIPSPVPVVPPTPQLSPTVPILPPTTPVEPPITIPVPPQAPTLPQPTLWELFMAFLKALFGIK